MDYNMRLGWIEVICGPMFAGKSEELIRRVKRLEYAKKKTIVFKPKFDNRYSESEVVTHNKRSTKSINLNNSSEVMQYIEDDTYAVAFDEIQFLDEGIIDVCEQLASKGIRVICAGLDNNFRGEPFSFMPNLICRAEYVTKLSAICVKCGKNATRTQRIIDGIPASYDSPVVVLGALESYEPRCRFCHEVPNKPSFFIKKD